MKHSRFPHFTMKAAMCVQVRAPSKKELRFFPHGMGRNGLSILISQGGSPMTDLGIGGRTMSSRWKIVSLVLASVTAIAAGLAAAAPAQASAPADLRGVLRNVGTGLCLDWQGSLNTGNITSVVSRPCTGSATQQWAYSEADQMIHNTGTDYCAVTGNTNAVFVATCADQWGQHWGYTSDGRFHQLDWTVGCMQDDKSWSYVSWTGICHYTDIEVWQHPTA